MKKIILYTKTGCPWSAGVRELLQAKKVPFEERNVTENGSFFSELLEKSGQTKTPTLDLDGEITADTDKEEVEKIFKDKKYPGF